MNARDLAADVARHVHGEVRFDHHRGVAALTGEARPATRASTDAPWSRAIATVATTSWASRGSTTPIGTWR